jgi:hypothetical protein
MFTGSQVGGESTRSFSRRRFAKVAVTALGVVGFAVAGLSGALAHDDDGWDDDMAFTPSGGVVASGGSGGSGWDDDEVFTGISGSGGSGGSGWDDDSDWDDDWDD